MSVHSSWQGVDMSQVESESSGLCEQINRKQERNIPQLFYTPGCDAGKSTM